MYSFTDIAWRLGVFKDRFYKHKLEAAVLVLPDRLQCVAACLAVEIFLKSDDNEQASKDVTQYVDQIQQMFQSAQLELRSC